MTLKNFQVPSPNLRLVTPRQLSAGYFVMIGGVIVHRNYAVIRKQGRNWLVVDPYDDYGSASRLLREESDDDKPGSR